MEKLIIGFSRSKKKFAIFSWLIRLVDGTKYSHVYIKWYSNKLQREIIYQASGTMVNFVGTSVFLEKNEIIKEYELEISDETSLKVKQFAMDKAGIKYGLKQVLGIGYVKLMYIFGKNVRNPFDDGSHTYVCSELVGEILKEKLNFGMDIDLQTITPKDIDELMELING